MLPIISRKPSKRDIEKRLQGYLKTDSQGRKIIEFGNGRLDFNEPFIYKGVTKSGNVKLQDTVNTTLKNGMNGFPNVRGILYRDTMNNKYKLRTGKGTGTSYFDLGSF